MDKMIACCGLECSSCDAYVATRNNDDGLRRKAAESWSKMFNARIEAKDINCLGCMSNVLFSHCLECDIRECNINKSQDNCSKCDDYACQKINNFFNMAPEAKDSLNSLRQQK
ncbi:MAG TPA: DUF3795 domain-containing protein [Bacillota bacterium]|nr:DUF3795 domain-containing protein [Bacillota bacterium]HOR85530.1 DUF3795 domain-containing protein [Bacillota bacterium]HPL53477.1 DUF3795 domain-containing protein [Bacillota bacterium]